MSGMSRAIARVYEGLWGEAPWVRAAGFVSAATAGLFYLNQQLPEDLAVDLSLNWAGPLIAGILVSVYFFLVAVLMGDQVRLQKRLRKQEQSFKYDKRGTLYNGLEPNIAFRIATFKGILAGVGAEVGNEEVARALINAGRSSASDFAKNLASIYDNDVARFKHGSPWRQLSFEDKLTEWSDYDSATGWGILAARAVNGYLCVSVTHFRELFEGEGGILFGQYLAGYSETVLTEIIRGHNEGKFKEYSGAKLRETNTKNKNLVEFEYELI